MKINRENLNLSVIQDNKLIGEIYKEVQLEDIKLQCKIYRIEGVEIVDNTNNKSYKLSTSTQYDFENISDEDFYNEVVRKRNKLNQLAAKVAIFRKDQDPKTYLFYKEIYGEKNEKDYN
jgi:hypothetical protein